MLFVNLKRCAEVCRFRLVFYYILVAFNYVLLAASVAKTMSFVCMFEVIYFLWRMFAIHNSFELGIISQTKRFLPFLQKIDAPKQPPSELATETLTQNTSYFPWKNSILSST